ncbi:entericidin A/B family lipoprotein [Methylocucumis oryzae]|nr:entericidin A/B family lipoprotein [Methylocucumis oryzae]
MKAQQLLFIIVLLALLTSCNAFRGLGKDIEKVGEAIQRS